MQARPFAHLLATLTLRSISFATVTHACYQTYRLLRLLHTVVTARFDALRGLLKTELNERQKALSSQSRELTIATAQLSAGVRLCEQLAASATLVWRMLQAW